MRTPEEARVYVTALLFALAVLSVNLSSAVASAAAGLP